MSATDLAAQATAAGASALFVSMVGVEPQVLVWGFVGSVLGVTLAPPSGRIYAIMLFMAATLTCSLLGTVVGDYLSPGSAIVRNSCAVIIGAIFHPMLSALIGAAPGLIDAVKAFVVRRIGGGQ